jgi:hypothetical protein
MQTWNVLWPVISRTTGPDLWKMRVFPFYGQSWKAGQYDKRFVMWPIWTAADYERPGSAGSSWLLFPVVGHVDMENQSSWTVLPPFFRFSRSATLRSGCCPWPFVQYSLGDINKAYLFPLAGWKKEANTTHEFLLWPIFSRTRSERTDEIVDRKAALPFVWMVDRVKRTAAGSSTERFFRLWPLFSLDRHDDSMTFRTLELWPIKSAPSERDFAPLWTVYSHERQGSAVEDDLLWGLFHRQRMADGSGSVSLFPLASWAWSSENGRARQWTLLKGLLGYRRDASGGHFRCLYVIGGDDHHNP